MRMLIAAATLLASTVAANAIWVHNKSEDPFQGDSHIALAVDPVDRYGAGFRCIDGKDNELTLLFATPERMDQEHLTMLNALPLTLMIIVDDQPKVEVKATADTVGENNLLRLQSSDAQVRTLLKAAEGARRRFAVAAAMMGKIVHSHTFDLRGSTKALAELESGCKLQ